MAKEMEKKAECPVPRGTLLIIGGAENKGEQKAKKKQTPSDFERFEILKNFVKLIGKDNPRIEIVTSASGEPDGTFDDYFKAFKELEVHNVGQLNHGSRKEALDDKELLDRLRDLDGIFFAGGDQLKYTSIYGGTTFLTQLKERYIYHEVVIAGTSAGAMAMSTPMIYAGNDEVQELGGMIKVTTGLEFLKDVCIDTHFVHRGRVVRMAQVIVTNPNCVGIGIEEDTAIIIRNGVEGQVVGTGTIIILEGFEISETSIEDFADEKPLTIRNLRMHILSADDKYKIPQHNPPHL
jgi:cyanophycinase